MAKVVGSKEQVFNGRADVTKGGKTKNDILRLPNGVGSRGQTTYRYVFKSRYNHGKKMMNKPTVRRAFEAQKFTKKNKKITD